MAIAVQGAFVAHTPKRGARLSRLITLVTALSLALTMAFAGTSGVAASGTASASGEAQPAKGSQAAQILRMLHDAVGHPFRLGSEGPRFFDCSGLVYSVYKRAGLVGRIGGVRGTVTRYYHWAQKHGKISRSNPQIGDVVIWGSHGKLHHSGIYVGNGRAISALNRKLGVRDWPMSWIHMRIWGFIHTGISR
ncbi:MAG: C40 family peptidase [Candidatus Limnocylindrales bacterium]